MYLQMATKLSYKLFSDFVPFCVITIPLNLYSNSDLTILSHNENYFKCSNFEKDKKIIIHIARV